MTILQQVLTEEAERLKRMHSAFEKELKALPEGYISIKRIKGKTQYYLQKRLGDKVKSQYISEPNRLPLQEAIARRKELKETLKKIERELKKIQKVI